MAQVHRGMVLMLVFAGLWALEEALLGTMLGRYGVAQLVWMRFAFHCAALLLWFGWREPQRLWRTQRPGTQWVRALALAAMPGCWALGVDAGIDQASLLTVFWLAPLLILGLGHLCLRKAVPLPTVGATFAASLGAWLLLGRDMPQSHEILLPLGMALSFAAFLLLTVALRGEALRANLFHLGLGVCVLLAPLLPGAWVRPEATDLLRIAVVGVVGLLGLLALERVVAQGPMAPTLPMLFVQLPCAVALAWWQGLHPGDGITAGSLVIVAAAAFAWRRELARRARQRLAMVSKRAAP